MKKFRLISWILWGLSIVVAITLALMHRKDLTLIPNITMWIFLICGNVSNVLITHKELKERGRYMKKFKIIKVKEY